MWGTSPVPDIGLEQIPHIDMKIVLNHNRILHFGYDESGTVSEEGYVHGHTGERHAMASFIISGLFATSLWI